MSRSNISAMIAGTLIAQGLPIALSPVLARVFDPEAFGLQSLVMGLTSILVVVSTLRLDLALIVAGTKAEVVALVRIVAVTTGMVCLVISGTLVVAGERLAGLAGYVHALPALWLVPPLVAATAAFAVQTGLWSRAGNLRPVALANVANQLAYAAVALGIGVASGFHQGLAIAKLAGQGAASSFLALRLRRHGKESEPAAQRPRLMDLWPRYWQFICFNTPYSLIGSVTREAPIIIFTSFAALPAAGLFALARTITSAPTLLATNAFSPIFYREAAVRRGQPEFFGMTHGLVTGGFLILLAPFAFCAVWGDVFFSLVFGAKWVEAGIFAMIMAPAAWLSTQTGWPERLAETSGRQGVTFTAQVIFDTVTILAMISTYVATGSAVMLVVVFAICNSAYQVGYLATLYHVAGFQVWSALKLCIGSIVAFAAVSFALCSVRFGMGNGMAGIVASLLLVAGFTGGAALWWCRAWKTGMWRKS